MGTVLLVDNIFSSTQYPGATIDAEEEATGHQAWRVGDGRRSALDYWEPTTANSDTWVRSQLTAAYNPNVVVLDRGHNLGGYSFKIQSDDNSGFSSPADRVSVTIPTTVSDDTDIDATNGALMPDGSWIKRFTSASEQYWRAQIPAMGAGLVPRIVGLWLGLAWSPDLAFPVTDDQFDAVREEFPVPATGWVGRSRTVRRRSGQLVFRPGVTYTDAATHLRDNFFRGRPMWICYDETRAERTVLADWTGQAEGLFYREDAPTYRTGSISWIEREPLVG